MTGAAGFLGRRIATDLLEAGARVAAVGRREGSLRPFVSRNPSSSLAIAADLRKEEDVRRMVRQVLARFGAIDILVNNAAVRGPTLAVTRLSRRAWQEVLDTNLTGPFLCARECLKHMARRRRGRIVNVSSVAGRMAYPLRVAYATSKWGLVGLTLTLAQEAGPVNIQVNAVCPGPVEGPIMDTVFRRRARALGISVGEARRRFLRATALGRMVTAADVSRAVLFLCSEGAQNITGHVLEVSAGFGLWPAP